MKKHTKNHENESKSKKSMKGAPPSTADNVHDSFDGIYFDDAFYDPQLLEEYKLPDDGFFDIVTVSDGNNNVDVNDDDVFLCRFPSFTTSMMNPPLKDSRDSNTNFKYVVGSEVIAPNVNGVGKRKAPPKPPRRSRSDSSTSGISNHSGVTDGSNLSLSSTNPVDRKVCTNCNCDPDEHEMRVSEIMDTYKKNRVSLHDANENIMMRENPQNDKYMWVPAGLESHLIDDYMSALPSNRVPHFKNPDGIAYHNKQLIHQIPLQDANFENVSTLSEDEKNLFDAFKRERDAQMASGKVVTADDSYECNKCKKDIRNGDLMVNAEVLGSEAVWHPGCFCCSTCDELLTDLIYCHRDAQIYCVRHFGELIKPRCCMCAELIFGGEYVRTDEKSYHAQHFVCTVCERGLSGQQHLVDNGLPICIGCYDEKYASTCHMCHKTIGVDEEDVIYDDEHWHDYCLVCNLCDCRLSGTSFVIRDDKFLCSECYQKTDEKRCNTCGKGFEPGAKRLELKGEFWHDTCFVCDICKDPITSKKFIQHEGKQVCCPCFDSQFAKRCDKCKEILREGGVACAGAFYHRDCFQCESCNTSIASQAFQQKDGNRYCMPCYKERYAKKCSGCESFIVNGEYYTVDTDSWHKECFKCEVCREVLQQQSFVTDNGKIKLVCEKCL